MKAHAYYIIFGRPPIGGKLPPFPPGGTTAMFHSDCLIIFSDIATFATDRVSE